MKFLMKHSLMVMAVTAIVITQFILPWSGVNDAYPIFNWSIFSFSLPTTQATTIRVTFKDNIGEHVCYLTLCPRELRTGNRNELIWKAVNWEKAVDKSLAKPTFFSNLDERITHYEILKVDIDHTKAFAPETITPVQVLGKWKE
nr:hypothetical protein BHI3_03960 [Bacteriovorax sp. HI3]